MEGYLQAATQLDHATNHYLLDYLYPLEARKFSLTTEAHPQAGRELRALIQEIDRLIPVMDFGVLNGSDNPNNGKPHHWYAIGKEYSRVLYLHIVKTYLDNSPPHQFRKSFDWEAFKRQLTDLAGKYRIDEYWVTEDTPIAFTARFWWD